MIPKINYLAHITSLVIVISAFVLLNPTLDNLSGTNSVFGYWAGISVNNTTILNGYAVADDTYSNGFRFKMRVTIASAAENLLWMRFDDWSRVSGGGTIPAASNMQVNLANSTAGALPASNTYSSNLSVGADIDPVTPGIQQDVYIWLKVPTSTIGGAYSTSYGVMSSSL